MNRVRKKIIYSMRNDITMGSKIERFHNNVINMFKLYN